MGVDAAQTGRVSMWVRRRGKHEAGQKAADSGPMAARRAEVFRPSEGRAG